MVLEQDRPEVDNNSTRIPTYFQQSKKISPYVFSMTLVGPVLHPPILLMVYL